MLCRVSNINYGLFCGVLIKQHVTASKLSIRPGIQTSICFHMYAKLSFRCQGELRNCAESQICLSLDIGIKHGFSCINIRQVPWEVLKTEAGGRGFQHLPRDLAIVNALKNHVHSYYCIKTENICYISRYFLHYFVSPFHRCLPNAISTDYARFRTGQYTSRNGSKSLAPVRSY